MCGIAGFNWKDEALGRKMNACLSHRGPDAEGIFADVSVTLSHRRLSIIDLSAAANQPMFLGSLAIVFNGEIYNFKELRQELSSRHEFKTESDTEVILAGYHAWGKEVVEKLNGIFALAIWDRENSTLFCARDHMGVKPLYYYFQRGKFIFASEMIAILEHDVARKLNPEAFNRYLRVLYSPEPETLIRDIYKLPPGHLIELKGGKLRVERYYSPERASKKWSYSDAKEMVRKTVSEAVERQLLADVPVGLYLSGGIDSSIVLLAASKVKKKVKTFSIGFELDSDEEEKKFNQDFRLARKTAEYFGSEHHTLTVSSEDVAQNLEKVLGGLDEPISNPTAIPMYLLSKFAKKEVTVVLSGNGGDELFGGYERYRTSVRADLIGEIPLLKHLFSKRIKRVVEMSALERLAQFEFEKDWRLSKVISPEVFQSMEEVRKSFSKYVKDGDKTEALMLADLKSWLPDQALLLGDKMSMRGSVEEREPFLDREVVDLAFSLPRKYKVDAFSMKKILKDAFKNELPEFLFREPKRGWFSPGAKWLRRKEVAEVAKRVLTPEYYPPTAELFNWPSVKEMFENHLSKKEYNLTILWAILTFQIWAKAHRITL